MIVCTLILIDYCKHRSVSNQIIAVKKVYILKGVNSTFILQQHIRAIIFNSLSSLRCFLNIDTVQLVCYLPKKKGEEKSKEKQRCCVRKYI